MTGSRSEVPGEQRGGEAAQGGASGRTGANLLVDAASLLVMLGLVFTGGLIAVVLPAGTGRFDTLLGWNRHDIGQAHLALAVLCIALLAVHVARHWGWICRAVARRAGRGAPSRRTRSLAGIAAVAGIAVVVGLGLVASSAAVERGMRPGPLGGDQVPARLSASEEDQPLSKKAAFTREARATRPRARHRRGTGSRGRGSWSGL